MKNITETILDNVCCYKVSHRGKHIPHDGNHNDLRKRTYQQVQSSIYVQFGLTMGQRAKFLFQFQKQPWHICRQQFLAPIQPKSKPFLQKARRERIVALKKNWETVPCSFYSFLSKKCGFPKLLIKVLVRTASTISHEQYSFFLIHPTGVNSQQCYCFILKLSDFPVAWTMLRDITRHLKFVHMTSLNFTKGYIFLTNVSSIFPSFFTLKQRLESAPNV